MKDRQDTDDIADSEIELEPFDKPVENDPTEAVEEAEPYFPPTDPVVRTDHSGETRIAGGFGSGETPEQRPQAAGAPSDEALEDLVHRALRLDASTAHLHLKVGVQQGVVRLQGPIEDEADAENALAVAGDVPGVVDVVDELARPE
ncbi:MAG TPA: BON domain-containing protein [Candidatus Bathyarchaeia archaeon]|nr:BON domain-containing protein [Candidatus Bathyarchaeia archaeon]